MVIRAAEEWTDGSRIEQDGPLFCRGLQSQINPDLHLGLILNQVAQSNQSERYSTSHAAAPLSTTFSAPLVSCLFVSLPLIRPVRSYLDCLVLFAVGAERVR